MSFLSLRSLAARRFPRVGRVIVHDQMVLSVLAVIIGVLVAIAEIGFREAIDHIQLLSFGFSLELQASETVRLDWWHVLLVPTAGGLAVGLMVWLLMPDRRTHGVPDVIEAAALRGGRMRAGSGLAMAAISATSLGVGASVGREGPAVHIGAALASVIAQRLSLSPAFLRTIIGCGAAAAVAAGFNAPIAGVFFAIEVVVGQYALRTFAPVVLSAVTATMVGRAHWGPTPAFIVPPHPEVSIVELPAFVALGVVSALVVTLFMRAIPLVQAAARASPVPAWLRPALAGFAVGLIGLAFPKVLGVGYEATDLALQGTLGFEEMLILATAKLVATAICLGGGFGGGIFSPSLFLGAMVGGAFGMLAGDFLPGEASSPGAYAMIGMGAVAGAVLGSPISTILIVFEMTGEYGITVAVMIAVVVTHVITEETVGHSFFHQQLQQRGIVLTVDGASDPARRLSVDQVMREDYVAVADTLRPQALLRTLKGAAFPAVFVVDAERRLLGVVTLVELMVAREADPEGWESLSAGDIARRDLPVLTVTDRLGDAIGQITVAGEGHLPVIDDVTSGRVVGVMHERDAMIAYRQALLEATSTTLDPAEPGRPPA